MISSDSEQPASTFFDQVVDRFGVLPNFFCSAEAAPGLMERLWDFARSAYLDNPLPSLFKERLFVHLSRFCVVRYCIVRHVGFLVGHGRPAGDSAAQPETVDEVIALLRRPIPASDGLEAALGRLSARKAVEPIPAPGSEFEYDLFDALTVLFLTPLASGRVREALRAAVGETNLEFLLAFMAFIRAAHYWTETHSELAYEADMVALMEGNPELGALLLDPAEAEQTRGDLERSSMLATLREQEQQFQAAVGALHRDLKVQEEITRDLNERSDAQRTRETLFQSQKMEALGHLTGGIAHDFNNLLAVIIGSLDIARRQATDPSVVRLIDSALSGAERGASLTQRMLVFARRPELESQPVDVVALVNGMADMLERSLGPSVRIETRLPAGIPCVKTDANQLEMALLNLAVNARDAMPQGGVVEIAAALKTAAPAHLGLQPGEYVCISVTDTGEGMDDDTLSHATNPFFTTKAVGKGTGLGLAMVHGLAEHSGGQLVLDSKKGRGTTAELWLAATTETESADRADTQLQAPVHPHRRLAVLVVDDDPLVLSNTAAMLDDAGHKVFEASSADEALGILRREPGVQLLITDQGMPDMTGLRLIEEVQAIRPGLPVILATGYAELPLGADAAHTLAKPFREYDLAHAVEAAVTALG